MPASLRACRYQTPKVFREQLHSAYEIGPGMQTSREGRRSAKANSGPVAVHQPIKVHVVQMDNGAEFQSQLHWHAEALDIRHVYPL